MRVSALLLLALVAGCASSQFNDPSGGIPPTTQLALSPNGQQLLVSWHEKANKTQARLLALSGKTVTAVRPISLPADTFTTAWSRDDRHVLVTTRNGEGSELLRIDLQANVRTVLYESASIMRFPLEVAEGDYVFLEGNKPGERYSRWQRLRGGQKTLLNDKIYGLAAPLAHVQGALFLFEPTRSFRVYSREPCPRVFES